MNILKITVTCLLLFASLLSAKEYEVKMLTADSHGNTMIFEPAFIKIAQGDTINFVPSDPSHNAQSFSTSSDKLTFSTTMGQPVSVTFSEEGLVLYKCLPHFALGMVGVVQVGDFNDKTKAIADWTAAQAGVVMNKERMANYLDNIK